MRDLQELERKHDYIALIRALKQRVQENQRVLADPYVKEWCGRRWRNLFISESVTDRAVLRAARRGLFSVWRDKRSPRQRIAERFLKGSEGVPREWELDLPEAQIGEVKNTTFVFCPGLLTGLLPVRAFEFAFPAIEEKYGVRIIRADLHPMRGCEANAETLLRTIERGVGRDAEGTSVAPEKATPPGDVCLICYSKGATRCADPARRAPRTATPSALRLQLGRGRGRFLRSGRNVQEDRSARSRDDR